MKSLDAQAQVRLVVADRSKVKHLAFDMISKQMIVQKTIRLPFESIAVDIMIVEQNGLMASVGSTTCSTGDCDGGPAATGRKVVVTPIFSSSDLF